MLACGRLLHALESQWVIKTRDLVKLAISASPVMALPTRGPASLKAIAFLVPELRLVNGTPSFRQEAKRLAFHAKKQLFHTKWVETSAISAAKPSAMVFAEARITKKYTALAGVIVPPRHWEFTGPQSWSAKYTRETAKNIFPACLLGDVGPQKLKGTLPVLATLASLYISGGWKGEENRVNLRKLANTIVVLDNRDVAAQCATGTTRNPPDVGLDFDANGAKRRTSARLVSETSWCWRAPEERLPQSIPRPGRKSGRERCAVSHGHECEKYVVQVALPLPQYAVRQPRCL